MKLTLDLDINQSPIPQDTNSEHVLFYVGNDCMCLNTSSGITANTTQEINTTLKIDKFLSKLVI